MRGGNKFLISFVKNSFDSEQQLRLFGEISQLPRIYVTTLHARQSLSKSSLTQNICNPACKMTSFKILVTQNITTLHAR